MTFCCENPLHIGCFISCGCLLFSDLVADQAGDWLLEWTYPNGESSHTAKVEFQIGENILFTGGYNESSVIYLRIFRPDATRFELNGSDCFWFTTRPVIRHPYRVGCVETKIPCACQLGVAINPSLETDDFIGLEIIGLGGCTIPEMENWQIIYELSNIIAEGNAPIFIPKIDGLTTYVLEIFFNPKDCSAPSLLFPITI